jgi:hypothetical protein
MTAKQGFTKGQLAYLGSIYGLASLIALVAAVFYWRLTGLLG